jgi:hypothetical protein
MCSQKKNKLLRNMKTRCINILSRTKHVMEQYQILIAKMHDVAQRRMMMLVII